MSLCEQIASLESRPAYRQSRLTDAEWAEVQRALERGVPIVAIYPLVADKYTPKGWYRAVENRLGTRPAAR